MYTYVYTEMDFSGVQLNQNFLKFRHYSASGLRTRIILTIHNVFFEMSVTLLHFLASNSIFVLLSEGPDMRTASHQCHLK